jgi:hypothetical protein
MLRARMPPPPNLPEMFRLEEVLDCPAEVVRVVGVTKAAFNAALLIKNSTGKVDAVADPYPRRAQRGQREGLHKGASQEWERMGS